VNHPKYPSMDLCSENSGTLVNKKQMNALVNAVLSERRNRKHTINIIHSQEEDGYDDDNDYDNGGGFDFGGGGND
jgi:hypothetical protein